MGYLATEIIVLLAGAAVLGLIIGWALFGLGKKQVVTASGAIAGNPKAEQELKSERDARKKAEGRIFELEAKETNFNDRLQERDAKVAELSHQLDEHSKYRVNTAAELDSRDQRIAALEAQLRQRDAELSRTGGVVGDDDRVADRDRQIAKLKTDLENALAAGSDAARVRELERENAELRQTLVATDGAAPTTASEKDAIIARLNEEVTGLRAAYESAEQALEEQDAAIDKLTRDLQSTQHRLAVATGSEAAPAPASGVRARPDTKPPENKTITGIVPPPPKMEPPPAKVEAPKPAPKPEPAKPAPVPTYEAGESTVAVSLADLVGQIDSKSDTKPQPVKPAPAPVPKAEPPKPAPVPAYEAGESTVALSLADLVGQIDSKADAKVDAPKPAPEPPKPAPLPTYEVSESTVALSLADLVGQIDSKADSKPDSKPAIVPAKPAPAPVPPPMPVEAPAASESTVALSLDDLVAQIDARPAKPAAPVAIEASESTVAVSLADLVGAIDFAPDIKLDVTPAPAGALDDLKEIRGIGPATEKRLNSAGILTWTQMAGLSEDQLLAVADLLKISVDKIKREQWVEQARALGGPR